MFGNVLEGKRLSRKDVGTLIAIGIGALLLGIAIGYNDDVSNHKIKAVFAQGPQEGDYTFGVLASIQNNQNGDPFWIVSGNWRTNLLDIANQSQMTARANMSQQGTLAPVFNTSVRMINFNVTGEHTHSITNFALENFITPNNMTTIFNGTSTGNFREGPITDIPITITITNDNQYMA